MIENVAPIKNYLENGGGEKGKNHPTTKNKTSFIPKKEKNLETILEESVQRNRSILESCLDGIVVIDSLGSIEAQNFHFLSFINEINVGFQPSSRKNFRLPSR